MVAILWYFFLMNINNPVINVIGWVLMGTLYYSPSSPVSIISGKPQTDFSVYLKNHSA